MVQLQTALTLLQEKFGEFDNVKFCLGDTDGMTSEAVEGEILRVAQGISSGEFPARVSLQENALKAAKITI